ncbi:MAG: lipid-A-disaccharide synthase N-terminal domain-containing protein [Gemmatimonadales bacterium]
MNPFWLGLGLLGQAAFSARWVVQWLATEHAKRTVVPLAFWILSLCGSTLLLSYSIYRRDPVFILGQSAGLAIYARNFYFNRRTRKA